MQFSTENRFTASTSPENGMFASKNTPEVALCTGIIICILSHSAQSQKHSIQNQKVHNLVDALLGLERSETERK